MEDMEDMDNVDMEDIKTRKVLGELDELGELNELNELFSLYKRTLPDIIRDEDVVRGIFSRADSHIIRHYENKSLVGASVIGGNVIYLLCVEAAFRGRGIGSALLAQSEAYIAANGYDKVIVGAGEGYIMPGIPMKHNAHLFFQRRGYVNAWGEYGSFDMMQHLADFSHTAHTVGAVIDGVHYRWATAEDLDGIIRCVVAAQSYDSDDGDAGDDGDDGDNGDAGNNGDVSDDGDNSTDSFAPYYKEAMAAGEPVLVAVISRDSADADNNTEVDGSMCTGSNTNIGENVGTGDIVGTLLIGIESEGPGIGSVGCTTTRPDYWGRGIATRMVTLGTKYLKDLGLPKAFLGYTYKDILNMYARAGYAVCMAYYMGEKKLHIRSAGIR